MIKVILKRFRMYYLLFFRYRIKKVGKDFYIGYNTLIRPNTLIVKDNVFIGNACHLAVIELTIGNNVMLASNVSIVGGDHKYNIVGTPIRSTGRDIEKSVIIEDDVWIGHQAIILHGIRIGEGSIVAAGSVVTKDVEPYSIYAGNPAKKIRDRFSKTDAEVHSKLIGGTYHSQINNSKM